MTEDVAVWRNSGDQSWAVNLKVNLADAALEPEGISRPDRETWFRAMAAYVRAHPDVSSEAMI